MKIHPWFFLLIFTSSSYSQVNHEIDKLFTKQFFHWEEISYNSSLLIPKFFKEGKYDSLEMVLNYWESIHGLTEPVIRFKILYGISNNSFSASSLDENFFDYLYSYNYLMSMDNSSIDDDWTIVYYNFALGSVEYPYISKEFNLFTMALASQLQLEVKPNSSNFLICEFYRNHFDSFYRRLKSPAYSKTELKNRYDYYIQNTQKIVEGNFAGYLSIWQPVGKNKILGAHPELGMIVGFKKEKLLGDLVIGFRLVDSKNKYLAGNGSKVIETKYFFGSYIGLEPSFEILRNPKFSLNFLTGLAYDTFDAERPSQKKTTISINSLNINTGIGFTYFFKKYSSKYLGFQLRYNLVNYDSRGGSDLSGNTISFRTIYGFSGNSEKNNIFRMLRY